MDINIVTAALEEEESFASRVEAQVISLCLRDKGLVSAGHVEGVMALEDESVTRAVGMVVLCAGFAKVNVN